MSNTQDIHYCWRTCKGEKHHFEDKIQKEDKNPNQPHLNWYRSADDGMENELVLCYSAELKDCFDKTGLKFDDRFLQKVTASGKPCSGKVSAWHSIAKEGTFNLDGTKV